MTERSGHCTSEQLQMLLDGQLSGGDKAQVAEHLQECARCMASYRSLEQIDRTLRDLPVALASEGFTDKVMEKVLPSGHLSLGFRIVENLAYLFAVLIVTGIITVVFLATGVIDSGKVSESKGIVSTYASATGTWLAEAVHGGTVWLQRYLPTRNGANILLSGIGILAALAVLDRFLHRRFAHRTR